MTPHPPRHRPTDPAVPAEVVHLPATQRAEAGKAARARVPRSSLARFDPPSTRPDPIALLESQAATRVPDLIPIRYGRMVESPFTFYRGAALVMASDLAAGPSSGIDVQLCGDAHLSNFGVFASPERALVFDINDFDETNPGPWEWDLKRLAASLEVAARQNGHSDVERRAVLLACAAQYRTSMNQFAGMGNMALWYQRIDEDTIRQHFRQVMSKRGQRRVERNEAKVKARDSMQALDKYTAVVDGQRRIVSEPPLIVRLDDMIAEAHADRDRVFGLVHGVLRRYRVTLETDRRHLLEQFELIDVARKVVGVGSVGTRCWMALFQGRDTGDPLFLQVKEAQTSVLEDFTGRSAFDTAGERVVAGQRLMQSVSDIFLGWDRNVGFDGVERAFYVRQLRDWKGSADVDSMTPDELSGYGRVCAWTLAKGHARSGDRIALAAYIGTGDQLDRAIASFATAYADQNERDHAALRAAIDSGRVKAEVGV